MISEQNRASLISSRCWSSSVTAGYGFLAKEMGGYGTQFSNIERHFMDAMVQAYNNENNVAGIVVNAFSESIIIRREMFKLFWDKECTS